jgi:hypothetical protein
VLADDALEGVATVRALAHRGHRLGAGRADGRQRHGGEQDDDQRTGEDLQQACPG